MKVKVLILAFLTLASSLLAENSISSFRFARSAKNNSWMEYLRVAQYSVSQYRDATRIRSNARSILKSKYGVDPKDYENSAIKVVNFSLIDKTVYGILYANKVGRSDAYLIVTDLDGNHYDLSELNQQELEKHTSLYGKTTEALGKLLETGEYASKVVKVKIFLDEKEIVKDIPEPNFDSDNLDQELESHIKERARMVTLLSQSLQLLVNMPSPSNKWKFSNVKIESFGDVPVLMADMNSTQIKSILSMDIILGMDVVEDYNAERLEFLKFKEVSKSVLENPLMKKTSTRALAKVADICWWVGDCDDVCVTKDGCIHEAQCVDDHWQFACHIDPEPEPEHTVEWQQITWEDEVQAREKEIYHLEERVQTVKNELEVIAQEKQDLNNLTPEFYEREYNYQSLKIVLEEQVAAAKASPIPEPRPVTPTIQTGSIVRFDVDLGKGPKLGMEMNANDYAMLEKCVTAALDNVLGMTLAPGMIIAKSARKGIAWGAQHLGPIVKDSFKGRIRTMSLQSDVLVPRIHGGTSAQMGRQDGIYLMTKSGIKGSRDEIMERFALPLGNDASKVSWFTIPKGTTIYVGRAEKMVWKDLSSNAQVNRGGGGVQIWVEDKAKLILQKESTFP